MSYTPKRRIRKRRPMAEINVVPYIDVMLVLLVIFMITAPLLSQGVKVALPKAAAKTLSSKQEPPIIVSVDRFGRYFVNIAKNPATSISAQTLMQDVSGYLQAAKRKHERRDVYVKGDRDVNYGKVVQAMVLLQRAGASNVGLITEPGST